MAVYIVTDSTCDLTKELTERFHVTVIPLFVTLNDAEYRDGVNIHAADVFRAVEMGAPLPKTAAVPVSDYADCFRSIKEDDPTAEIVCIAISAKFSSCYQNACIAAADFEHVYVVDSMNLSTGIGLVVLEAAELATSHGIDLLITNGKNPEKLYDIIEKKKVGTLFVARKK